INGQRVSGTQRITMKDTIQIGKYTLKLQLGAPLSMPQVAGAPKGGTMLLRANSASILMPAPGAARPATETASADAIRRELEQLRKKAEVLSHIYELNSMFNSVFNLD